MQLFSVLWKTFNEMGSLGAPSSCMAEKGEGTGSWGGGSVSEIRTRTHIQSPEQTMKRARYGRHAVVHF